MKRLLMSLVISAMLIVPQFASGSDLDDLKAFNAKIISTWNSLDAEGIVSMHCPPGAVILETGNPFPSTQTKEEAVAGLKMWFASLDFLNVTPYDVHYRVVGDTGIVWGYYTATGKPKGGPAETTHARYTMTAVKSGGKWQVLMIHQSSLPN